MNDRDQAHIATYQRRGCATYARGGAGKRNAFAISTKGKVFWRGGGPSDKTSGYGGSTTEGDKNDND